MSGDYDWRQSSEIDRWVKDWQFQVKHKSFDFTGHDDPLDELQHRVERGDFSGPNRQSVNTYLTVARGKVHRVSDEGRADREERAVVAAERSAKWAGWAIAVALGALALSGWPYIKEWL